MTNKNTTRNFLAAALATASVATLMLGSSAAFAAATPTIKTTVTNPAAYDTPASWTSNSVVADGDSLKASGNSVLVNANTAKTITFNSNGTTDNVITVSANTQAGFAGIVGTTPVTIKAGADTSTIVLGKGSVPNFAVDSEVGDYRGLGTINFDNKAATVSIEDSVQSGVLFTSSVVNSILQINATNVELTGAINATALQIKVLDSKSLALTNDQVTTGKITLTANSDLKLTGTNLAINSIVGAAAGNGTLTFNAGKGTILTTTAAGNAIGKVVVDGSTAVKNTGTQGIKMQTLAFTNTTNAATGGSFQLADAKTFANYEITTITSESNNSEVRFSGANQVIASGNTVGAADKIINFRFMDQTAPFSFTINEATKFFGRVSTNTDGVGAVLMNVDGAKVYGLGELGKKLLEVTFVENGANLGDTYANTVTIEDNKTVRLEGTVDALVKLANGSGVTNLILGSNVNLLGDIKQDSNSQNNTVTFVGSAKEIGNIGDTAGGPIAAINFGGARGSVANFRSGVAISVNTIDFKDTAINLSRGDLTINAAISANINANVTLGSSQLNLVGNGAFAAGPQTSVNTTVMNNNGTITAGLININANLAIADNTNIVFTPTLGTNVGRTFTVAVAKLDNSSRITGNNVNFVAATNANAYIKSTIVPTDDRLTYNLVNIDNTTQAVAQDFATAGITDETDISNSQLLVNATRGDALDFVNNTGEIADAAMRVSAFRRLTNSNSVQIASVNQRLLAGSDNAIIERVSDTALQVNRNELGQGAPAAAGDEARAGGAPMGAWLAPVYSQETQKGKGGSAGYKVKSGGAIVGIDTEANDNLIIGAAATIVSSDMKMKDYKAGDKAKINSFMFSLYGSQELVRDFFVQGVASFSNSKIKSKERRIVPTRINDNGYETANANYDSIGFSGKVLLGYNAKPMEGVFLTPVAGLRYSKTNDEAYTETGTSKQNKSLSKQSADRVDAIVGVQVETNVKSQGIAFVPEAHVYVTHKVGGKSGKVNATLDGLNTSFIGRKDTTGKTLYNAGLGVKTMYGAMEYGASYDAYFASKYIAHQGSLKVRVNF